jgi:hypothetical protein
VLQYSATHRNNNMADISTDLGATSYLLVYTGAVPATCATAASGTLLASLPCSATFGTASAGVLTANAITTAAAAAGGTAGYWRLCTTSGGTTVVVQGLCYGNLVLSTNASTATGNVLPFASTTGVVVGMTVTGTNIPAATYVLAVTGIAVTLNNNITGTVANVASITFGGELTFTGGVVFAQGQNISVSSLVLTATGA